MQAGLRLASHRDSVVRFVPMTSVVDVSDLKELEADLRGRIYLRTSEGYNQARQVWNGMIDKRPLAIVGAASVADVMATVKFAQSRSLPVAIRGGRHNVAGSAVCDDGIVIDLAPMKSVRVDPVARRARAPRVSVPSKRFAGCRANVLRRFGADSHQPDLDALFPA